MAAEKSHWQPESTTGKAFEKIYSNMNISLGYSPCPNDTFIFDAMANGTIDTEGLAFETSLEDVETLNQWAMEGRLDVTKLSFPALFRNASHYRILSSGAALGKGVGPLLIGKKKVSFDSVEKLTIAIPGVNTTANLLLSYAFPNASKRTVYLFSDIEDAVLEGRCDLGVIIHENRFTYAQKGLEKICDLGTVWEEKENVPIPLGCIAAHKRLDTETMNLVDGLIRKSLTHAFAAYPALSQYVQKHAQAMDEQVMRQHIELYVNNYTMDLGSPGRAAIDKLFEVYKKLNDHVIGSPSLFQD
jgi:1,4-dihydroxy-6-naphthoate synthase